MKPTAEDKKYKLLNQPFRKVLQSVALHGYDLISAEKDCLKIAEAYAAAVKSEPAEAAEEILKPYLIKGDDTSLMDDIFFVSRGCAISAMNEFAALYAQRLADKMVEEMYPKAFVEWFTNELHGFGKVTHSNPVRYVNLRKGSAREYSLDDVFEYWKENVK